MVCILSLHFNDVGNTVVVAVKVLEVWLPITIGVASAFRGIRNTVVVVVKINGIGYAVTIEVRVRRCRHIDINRRAGRTTVIVGRCRHQPLRTFGQRLIRHTGPRASGDHNSTYGVALLITNPDQTAIGCVCRS